MKVAWESLWHPPPPGCAEEFRHSYLAECGPHVDSVALDKVDRFTITELGELLADHEEARNQIDRITQEIAQLSGVEDRIQEVTGEIEKLNDEDRNLSDKISILRRQEELGSRGFLNQKRPVLARFQERFASAQPNLTRASQAELISTLIGEAIGDLYPIHVQRLSEEMTTIYRRLAHKGLVKRIEISPDCSVRLLGDRGRDLRDMDLSAGEEQIFALSLIAAIARVSGASVPVIMDTPLARLDTDHRTNVLKYFASKVSDQVVFLSQPDEVHGPYLNVIRNRSRLAVSYRVRVRGAWRRSQSRAQNRPRIFRAGRGITDVTISLFTLRALDSTNFPHFPAMDLANDRIMSKLGLKFRYEPARLALARSLELDDPPQLPLQEKTRKNKGRQSSDGISLATRNWLFGSLLSSNEADLEEPSLEAIQEQVKRHWHRGIILLAEGMGALRRRVRAILVTDCRTGRAHAGRGGAKRAAPATTPRLASHSARSYLRSATRVSTFQRRNRPPGT